MTTPFEPGTLTISRAASLRDYAVASLSRTVSQLGRREVLSGRGKFGIFGDGKEIAQVAMAYAFKPGDWRAGYYRDQTFMMALGLLTPQQLFAQLYGHADVEAEPGFAGRSMTGHFATRLLDPQGRLLSQGDRFNSAADLSPTAAQMPKLVGLAYASKLYREIAGLADPEGGGEGAGVHSHRGDEVAFGTIGNASCAEGMFWESVNAVGVLQAPLVLSIWDDGYGISVPNRFQMTKGDVSKVLEGFQRRQGGRPGFDIHTVPGWDYPRLCETYLRAADAARRAHVPSVIHVTELTQPFGHSTSGSHERYKSAERLEWEAEFDCLVQMRRWLIGQGLATEGELDGVDQDAEREALAARDAAWEAYNAPIREERDHLREQLTALGAAVPRAIERESPLRRDLQAAAHAALLETRGVDSPQREAVLELWRKGRDEGRERYSSHLYSESAASALRVAEIAPRFADAPEILSGFQILNRCFDLAFEREPRLFAIGEDVGQLGDVNQGLADLQEKYGALRITDTGIRETTIIGQAIGMALRGLRPIAEIQYLDYILYALQILSDDLASLRWRTAGGQMAPVIVRTRGHRLEGIWHSGSPMSAILSLVRGLYVCVPRDATRAAGFYNTLIASDDAAIVVEVLNGYRRKEPVPSNLGGMRLPLGVPEILRAGGDVTVVTYGALVPIVMDAAEALAELGVEVEVIDVQTLLPFDSGGIVAASVRKTNRVVFCDEDVPGGATSFMLQNVLERDRAFHWLDAPPVTLTAQEHRPAYGSDGDYFSKPQREDVITAVYELVREADPTRFPQLL